MIFVQTEMKRMETTTSHSPSETIASAHDTKEEVVMVEVDHGSSSTLGEERKIETRKCLKEMALVPSSYDIDFRNFSRVA